VTQVSFKLDRLETGVEFTILGPNDMPVVAAQILFQVMDNGGRMFIFVPQAALYPLRKKLALMLALLECAPPACQRLDVPDPAAWIALAWRAAVFAAASAAAFLLLTPVHLVLGGRRD
jgi:hypothetical protein